MFFFLNILFLMSSGVNTCSIKKKKKVSVILFKFEKFQEYKRTQVPKLLGYVQSRHRVWGGRLGQK